MATARSSSASTHSRMASAANGGGTKIADTVAPVTLAAYQDGAVVSRTLLKRGGGTVTLFAFDEGQSLSCLLYTSPSPRD